MAQLVEMLVDEARKTAQKPELKNMSYEEAYNFVLDSLSVGPRTYEEGLERGVYSSKEDFIQDRIKLAYALKSVVAKRNIGIDQSEIGVVCVNSSLKKPDDLSDEEWAYFCRGSVSASWMADIPGETNEGVARFSDSEFLGTMVLREQGLFKDVAEFSRIVCHELGHTRQFFEGRAYPDSDRQIDKDTKDFVMKNKKNPFMKYFDVVIHEAKENEKDADKFSFLVINDLIEEASKKNGMSSQAMSYLKRVKKEQRKVRLRHSLSEKVYPMIRAMALSFTKKFEKSLEEQVGELKTSAEREGTLTEPKEALDEPKEKTSEEEKEEEGKAPEEDPKKEESKDSRMVEKVSPEEMKAAGFDEQKAYSPTSEQLKDELKERPVAEEPLEESELTEKQKRIDPV